MKKEEQGEKVAQINPSLLLFVSLFVLPEYDDSEPSGSSFFSLRRPLRCSFFLSFFILERGKMRRRRRQKKKQEKDRGPVKKTWGKPAQDSPKICVIEIDFCERSGGF